MMMTKEDFVKAIDERYSWLLAWTIKDCKSYGEDVGWGLAEDVRRYRTQVMAGAERQAEATAATKEAGTLRAMLDGLETTMTAYAAAVERLEDFVREGEEATDERRQELIEAADKAVREAYDVWTGLV